MHKIISEKENPTPCGLPDGPPVLKKEPGVPEPDEEAEDSDSTPDVPDVPDLIVKIKSRFAHNVTEPGNSCSRCEMHYVHKRARKQRPTELDVSLFNWCMCA